MSRRSLLPLAALACGLSVSATLAADLIVVEARGVNLRQGQKVDDTKKLTLADGQRVTLIASNGRTLKLTGPYDEVPSAEGTAEDTLTRATAALEAMKVQKVARLTEIGTVRTKEVNDLPDPWLVDTEHDGNVCVPEGRLLVFWRANSQGSAPFLLTPSDRSWSARYDWPAGADRLTMPKLFPIRDRATYVVELGGARVRMTFNVIPAAVANDFVRKSWMMEKGCIEQAAALEKTLSQRPGG